MVVDRVDNDADDAPSRGLNGLSDLVCENNVILFRKRGLVEEHGGVTRLALSDKFGVRRESLLFVLGRPASEGSAEQAGP